MILGILQINQMLISNFFEELSKNLSDDADIINMFKSYVDRLSYQKMNFLKILESISIYY